MMGGWWTIAWAAWIVLFLIIEGFALVNSRHGDTLSEHVWAWFGVRRWGTSTHLREVTWRTRLRRLVLVLFLAWLVVHFLSGGWV